MGNSQGKIHALKSKKVIKTCNSIYYYDDKLSNTILITGFIRNNQNNTEHNHEWMIKCIFEFFFDKTHIQPKVYNIAKDVKKDISTFHIGCIIRRGRPISGIKHSIKLPSGDEVKIGSVHYKERGVDTRNYTNFLYVDTLYLKQLGHVELRNHVQEMYMTRLFT